MFVPIIMGSLKDMPTGSAVKETLEGFGVPCEIRVASAHKAPEFLLGLLRAYEATEGSKVYITIAGRSNALSALIDANVSSPVIACPPYSDKYAGSDIFSSLRMPSGVAPAVVLDPKGAALVAAKIFGLLDPEVREKVTAARTGMEQRVRRDDGTLREGI